MPVLQTTWKARKIKSAHNTKIVLFKNQENVDAGLYLKAALHRILDGTAGEQPKHQGKRKTVKSEIASELFVFWLRNLLRKKRYIAMFFVMRRSEVCDSLVKPEGNCE